MIGGVPEAAAPFHADIAAAPPGARACWAVAQDGVRLRLAVWEGGERGTVVVLPGRSEFIEKYGPVVGRLRALGLSVAVIDWRGQGLSQRSPEHGGLGHVEDFRDYQRDMAALLAAPPVAALPAPRYLLAHSMGGCIALRTLRDQPEVFAAAILSAPMWNLQLGTGIREAARRLATVLRHRARGARPGATQQGAFDAPFHGNALTSDPERFAWCAAQIDAHPELALGGPSLRWTRAALCEMARLGRGPLPALPVLVFLGSAERMVGTEVIRRRTLRMPRGELVLCAGARHEILQENDAVQAQVWRRISAFLDAQRG